MRFMKPAALTFTGLLSVLGVCALASPAQAAGLPQLDVTKFPPQVIWLAISFIVLYVVMAKTALPRVGQILEERQNRIDDNLAKAEQLKVDAEAAAEAYETSLAQSRAKAQNLLREARETAATEAAKRQDELSGRLTKEIAEAEARIAAAKDAAMAEVRTIAAEVAQGAAAKLIGDDVDAAAATAAVDAVAEEGSK